MPRVKKRPLNNISIEQRCAIKTLIQTNMKETTPVHIVDRIELRLYEVANGNSEIYCDSTTIKQRMLDVFTEFNESKQASTKKASLTRTNNNKSKKAKNIHAISYPVSVLVPEPVPVPVPEPVSVLVPDPISVLVPDPVPYSVPDSVPDDMYAATILSNMKQN